MPLELRYNPLALGITTRNLAFPCSSVVEQLTVNQRAIGSNPIGGAILFYSLNSTIAKLDGRTF